MGSASGSTAETVDSDAMTGVGAPLFCASWRGSSFGLLVSETLLCVVVVAAVLYALNVSSVLLLDGCPVARQSHCENSDRCEKRYEDLVRNGGV